MLKAKIKKKSNYKKDPKKEREEERKKKGRVSKIKINYEGQFLIDSMLNDKIKKKYDKKMTRVNPS
jgi:hypothetical protein